MNVHVSLNLLIELRERDFILFQKEQNKFNNTGAQFVLWDTKLLKNHIFGVKTSMFCHFSCNVIMDLLCYVAKSVKLVVFLHGVISLPNAISCDNMLYFQIALSRAKITMPP